jgi:hypothetical protein
MSKNDNRKLVRNAALCLECDDVVESTHSHDFVRCFCENLFVDGGLDNPRRGFRSNEWVDLCEYEED